VDYRHKWKQRLFRKNDIHIPQLVYKYNLTGTRNVRLSNKRRSDPYPWRRKKSEWLILCHSWL